MFHASPWRFLGCVLLGLGVLLPGRLFACNIPVYRYALERWPADPYQVVVFYKGSLTKAQEGIVANLEKAIEDEKSAANIEVERAEIGGELDADLANLWKRQKPSAKVLPWMAVRFPIGINLKKEDVVWSGPLSGKAARALLDSPKRREVARRLLKGDSVVWLLLESGQPERAARAAGRLKKLIPEVQKMVAKPLGDSAGGAAPTEGSNDGGPGGPDAAPAPAAPKLAFSVLRMSRSDPGEQFFTKILLAMTPETSRKQTLLFPIFGRGRALDAIAGKDIKKDVILDAAEFLSGPCSCQVKELNPGMDILIAANWEALIGNRMVVDKALPPLTGFSAAVSAPLQAAKAAVAAPGVAVTPDEANASAKPLLTVILLVVVALSLVVAVAAAVVAKAKKS